MAIAALSAAALNAPVKAQTIGGPVLRKLHYVYISTLQQRYTPRSISISYGNQHKCFSMGKDYGGRELKTKYSVPSDTTVYVALYGDKQQENLTCSGWPYAVKNTTFPVTDKNKYVYFYF